MVTKSELAKSNRTSGCRAWSSDPKERKGLCHAYTKCYCKWFKPLDRRVEDYRTAACRFHNGGYCTCWAALREAREEFMKQRVAQALEEL